jgi:3-deoxy-manno-octulosonate cytidylyltransferase (CMP-KDO synthetase)
MIIIPARLASTRFPQKVLADIGGLPMVIRTAKRVESIDRVVVACDDEKILDICAQFGIEARLTSTTHNSGTDRINECAQLLDIGDDEIVINVQADEPFIETEALTLLIERLNVLKSQNAPFIMASCYSAINHDAANDPNLVKVITDIDHNAIYFSRSPIPFNRSGEASYFGHIGIYGFTKKSLHDFCALDEAPLENIEKLEQLRAIYSGKKISMVNIASSGFGIDTVEDLERAKKIFGV